MIAEKSTKRVRRSYATKQRETAITSAKALGAGLALASGAATFGVEVLWVRSYVLVIGSSVYAFNVMLLAVLLGIAGGAAVYGRVRPRLTSPVGAVGGLVSCADTPRAAAKARMNAPMSASLYRHIGSRISLPPAGC